MGIPAKGSMSLFTAPASADALRIVPLGGCGEFGMNLTCYLHRQRLYVVDCGVRFPDPIKLGTDAIIPHVDPFFEKTGGVYAYVMTHAHEDHIGAMPHILPRWPAPVYGTAWTLALIRLKLNKLGIDPERFSLIEVDAGDKITNEDFSFEFVHVNHSIPMTCALYIKTPAVNIFHTGDFKFDDQPIIEAPAAWPVLQRIGNEGVDLLVADSTNAATVGPCPGEASVVEPLTQVFKAAPQAVLISTFASNLWRLISIIEASKAAGRRVFITGPGVEQTLAVASSLGMYNMLESMRIEEADLRKVPRQQLVVLATGCQGEWRAAMARIANGEHRAFKIEPNDTVVLSSRIIPGNEKPIYAMLNNLLAKGAKVVTAREAPGIHVSGHAYRDDLDRLIKTLKPKNYTPMHGGFSQMLANWEIGRDGVDGGTSQIMQNGDVLEATKKGVTKLGHLAVETRYIDGQAAVILPPEVLKDRLKLGELGGALVTGAYNARERRWVSPPEVELIGLKLPDRIDEEEWLETQATMVRTRLPQLVAGKGLTRDDAYEEIRISLRRQLAAVLQKKPIVLVKVHLL